MTAASAASSSREEVNPTPKSSKTFDLKTWAPIRIGPTWQVDTHGDWILPELTLGWQIAGWVSTWLTDDDGGPFMFTAEQLRFILWFYAIDRRGRFVYSDALLQRCKGWG